MDQPVPRQDDEDTHKFWKAYLAWQGNATDEELDGAGDAPGTAGREDSAGASCVAAGTTARGALAGRASCCVMRKNLLKS